MLLGTSSLRAQIGNLEVCEVGLSFLLTAFIRSVNNQAQCVAVASRRGRQRPNKPLFNEDKPVVLLSLEMNDVKSIVQLGGRIECRDNIHITKVGAFETKLKARPR